MSSAKVGGPKNQEWQRILRHFYKIHPPPEDWKADEWDDAAWRDKIDRIIATYQKKAAKAAQKAASPASPGGRVAAARAAFQSLEAGAPQRINTPKMLANTTAVVASAIGHTLAGGHALRLAEARPENTYLCNETHHRALKALDGGPRAAYFVHLPYAAEDDSEHRRLAASVAELLRRLVEVSMADS